MVGLGSPYKDLAEEGDWVVTDVTGQAEGGKLVSHSEEEQKLKVSEHSVEKYI